MRDSPLDPINLAIDRAGNIIVASYAGAGTVYAFKPGASEDEIVLLKPEPVTARPGVTPVLPVGDWRLQADVQTGAPLPRLFQYLSPDGSVYISATQDFVRGAASWGVKSSDLLRSFGLAPAVPGKPFYITDEAEVSTWEVSVGPDGNLSGMKLFANQGGEGVAVDAQGNVYVAAGQVYVHDSAGRLIDTIEVPERPLQLVFGGKDGRTLFIPARSSLYAVRTRYKGR